MLQMYSSLNKRITMSREMRIMIAEQIAPIIGDAYNRAKQEYYANPTDPVKAAIYINIVRILGYC